MKEYLDAGGKLFIAYFDEGYYANTYPGTGFYTNYLQGHLKADSGSQGPITGADIMAGVNMDLTSASYPDSFALGPNAVGIFANTAPLTDWAGSKIVRNDYQVIYLGFSFYQIPVASGQRQPLLEKALKWLATVDVPWLSETPTMGTIPADTGNVPVTVGFNAGDASITQPGTYTAMLKVANEDDGNTPLSVPVTMTVLSSATQGKLNGTISGLLYCDGGPGTPLNNASVHIFDGVSTSITLTTNTAGYYQQWLDAGTYNVTVSAANYLAQSVAAVAVTGGMTTTQDVNLRWLKACVNAAPTSLSATVNLGANTSLPFTLTNLGAVSTLFKISELEGIFNPYAPSAADVLIVNETSAATTAMKTALTALGYTYAEVTSSVYTGMTLGDLFNYRAVLYAGAISSGAERNSNHGLPGCWRKTASVRQRPGLQYR